MFWWDKRWRIGAASMKVSERKKKRRNSSVVWVLRVCVRPPRAFAVELWPKSGGTQSRRMPDELWIVWRQRRHHAATSLRCEMEPHGDVC